MKKRYILLLALLCSLLLGGCTKELADEPLTLSFAPEETALFTGTLSDGVYNGVLTGSGWRFEGTFRRGGLLDGTGEGISCHAALFGRVEDGTYTGALVSGIPDGEGVFTLSSGAAFTGEFSGGAAGRGEAVLLPWALTRGESRCEGVYSGAMGPSGPDGSGCFDGKNAALQRFVWDGGWTGGAPSGSGTLTDDGYVTVVEGRETAGEYTGEGSAAIPEGEGVFTAADENGVPFTYTGEWAAGLMDGAGTLAYDAEALYTRTGTFTAGRFAPSRLETLVSLGTCEPKFSLSDSQTEFLENTPDLWEREDHQDFFQSVYRSIARKNVTVAQCFSDGSYRDDPFWIEVYGMRIITARTGALIPGGADMTFIFAADRNYAYPCVVLVPGTVDRLRQGNSFHIYAMPIAVSPYVNTLGEERQCLVLLAGDIYTGM